MLIAEVSAHSQSSLSSSRASATYSSQTESSPTKVNVVDETGAPALSAVPRASGASGAAAGQNGGGSTSHGIFSHLAAEAGGGGFYRKVTSFTDPQEVYECYYFCGVGYENVVVSHFSSNQWGANAGIGMTNRLGGTYGDGTAKLFA